MDEWTFEYVKAGMCAVILVLLLIAAIHGG
jgi:hypothetical protein